MAQSVKVEPTEPVKAATTQKRARAPVKRKTPAAQRVRKPTASRAKRAKAVPPQPMKGGWVLPHGMGLTLGTAASPPTDSATTENKPSDSTHDNEGDDQKGENQKGDSGEQVDDEQVDDNEHLSGENVYVADIKGVAEATSPAAEENLQIADEDMDTEVTIPTKQGQASESDTLTKENIICRETHVDPIDDHTAAEQNASIPPTTLDVSPNTIKEEASGSINERAASSEDIDTPVIKEEDAVPETQRRVTRAAMLVKVERTDDKVTLTSTHLVASRKLVVIKGVGRSRTAFVKLGKKITVDASQLLDPDYRINVKRVGNPYGLTAGYSPYIYRNWPTPEACREVYRLLAELHGECIAPEKMPVASLEVAGCGEVPCVLDAVLRTLISGNTQMARANQAIKNLADHYGVRKIGSGKGSIDWDKVRFSSHEELTQVIRCAGDGPKRSRFIKQILDMVYADNVAGASATSTVSTTKDMLEDSADITALAEAKYEENSTDDSDLSSDEEEVTQTSTTADSETDVSRSTSAGDERDLLSIDYMHKMTKDEALTKFVSFPGIGIKTAACVTLFCLRIPCFAVDTHVHRFCGWLGWTPLKADPDNVFRHCDYMVPDDLKYGLHQLFIRHGQLCYKCRASTKPGTKEWNEAPDCPLEHLLTRKKEEAVSAKPKPKRKQNEIESDADGEEADEKTDDEAKPPKKTRRRQPKKKSEETVDDEEDSQLKQESDYEEKPKAKRTRKPRAQKASASAKEASEINNNEEEPSAKNEQTNEAETDVPHDNDMTTEDDSESQLSQLSQISELSELSDVPMEDAPIEDPNDDGSEYEE